MNITCPHGVRSNSKRRLIKVENATGHSLTNTDLTFQLPNGTVMKASHKYLIWNVTFKNAGKYECQEMTEKTWELRKVTHLNVSGMFLFLFQFLLVQQS